MLILARPKLKCSTETNVFDQALPKQDMFRPYSTQKSCSTQARYVLSGLDRIGVCFSFQITSYSSLNDIIYAFPVTSKSYDAFLSEWNHDSVAGKTLKKGQKGFFRHFLAVSTKKLHFFGACSRLKIIIYWRQRRLKKNFMSVIQNWISLNCIKGVAFGLAGGRTP